MEDPTEEIRRNMVEMINGNAGSREELEKRHGRVWDTDELQKDFEVIGFRAPFCCVERRDNGEKGSLQFQHEPRFYFRYQKGG